MKIPLFKINWAEDDITAISEIIRAGKYWCIGSQIDEFESLIANYIGSKYCVVFNSGGSALHAVMYAHGISPNDNVIVPSFTFIATAYAPMYVGAKPVFADIEEETFGIDPEKIANLITSKTRAIIPIHYGGIPCKIKSLKEIAEDAKILLIEDAAEAFGARYKNQHVGTFGDSAIFSFCQNKIFTTGEGGCVVTDNREVYEKLKLFKSYGRVIEGNYFDKINKMDYVEIGHNFRLSTILAALGISQLKRVDSLIDLRRKAAKYLDKQLMKIPQVKVISPRKESYAVYQLYTIMVSKERSCLIKYLQEKGVATKIYFEPVHKYSVFENIAKNVSLPVTEKVANRVLSLPMYPQISKNEMDYVTKNIKMFFNNI